MFFFLSHHNSSANRIFTLFKYRYVGMYAACDVAVVFDVSKLDFTFTSTPRHKQNKLFEMCLQKSLSHPLTILNAVVATHVMLCKLSVLCKTYVKFSCSFLLFSFRSHSTSYQFHSRFRQQQWHYGFNHFFLSSSAYLEKYHRWNSTDKKGKFQAEKY